MLWWNLVVITAAADQLSKLGAAQSTWAEQPQILTPFLRLVYTQNTGIAFSFLANYGEWGRWLLAALAAAVIIVLAVLLHRRPRPLESAGLTLLMGGAFGNLIDRLRLGYVVDFIDVHWGVYHWPAFNIADSAITAGAALLLWGMWQQKPAVDAPL